MPAPLIKVLPNFLGMMRMPLVCPGLRSVSSARGAQSRNKNLVWIVRKLIGYDDEVEQWINEERSHELIPIWEQDDKFVQIWSEGGGWRSNLITRYLAVPSLWPLPGTPLGLDHNWRGPPTMLYYQKQTPPTSRFMLYWSTPVKKWSMCFRRCIIDK